MLTAASSPLFNVNVNVNDNQTSYDNVNVNDNLYKAIMKRLHVAKITIILIRTKKKGVFLRKMN